jgi:hypothetical protein
MLCAHACEFLPGSILTPHWNKLLMVSAGSALPRSAAYRDRFVQISGPGSQLRNARSYVPVGLAVFACDFNRLSPRFQPQFLSVVEREPMCCDDGCSGTPCSGNTAPRRRLPAFAAIFKKAIVQQQQCCFFET